MAHGADGVADAGFLAELSDEILGAARAELALRARARNGSLPVHRLPCDVVRYLAALLPFRDRVYAATTCHYWRECMLSDERLWREPILTCDVYQRTHMAACLLERAHNKLQSLAVQSDSLDDDASAEITSLLEPCIMHLTSLTIFIKYASEQGPWHRVLTSRAPNLEILRVTRTSEGVFDLPPNLFDGQCPKLRTVLLYGTLPSSTPCPAFAQVTTLRYWNFSAIPSDTISDRFSLTPNLEHLVVSSIRYVFPSAHAPWTIPPLLKSLSVRRNITDGIFTALAAAVLARSGRVLCYEPIAMYIDTLFFSISLPSAVTVHWLGSTQDLKLLVFNEAGASNGVSRVQETDVLRLFEFSLLQLMHITSLTLPDTLWKRASSLSANTPWGALVSLTVHLTHVGTYDTAYTHVFLLQDPPLSALCPVLDHVHLIHDAMRGTAFGAYLHVIASDLQGWLPETVSTLRVRGIIIQNPGEDALRSKFNVEESAFHPEDETLSPDDSNWEYVFPLDDAWRL